MLLALVPGHSIVANSVIVDFRFTGFMDRKPIYWPGTTGKATRSMLWGSVNKGYVAYVVTCLMVG